MTSAGRPTNSTDAYLSAEQAYLRARHAWNARAPHRSGPALDAREQDRRQAARRLVRDAARRHRVQERCAVWLRLAPDGWVIDAPTLDGYPLEGFDDGPGNDACPCPDPRECEALRSAAALLPLPTAEDLIVLLREATALSGPHEGVGPDGSGTWSGQDQPPRGGPEPAWALVRDAARRHAVTERSVLRLRLTPHGWALHPAALEMGPLPGYPCGPLTEECECADPAECAALRRAAALLARPDARDLLALLEQTQ